ncbi:hypothetical protein GIB67_035717 [Kingdonia uniflora]|uniref:Uncharacterized protein n=1 Tax=Kingdonia uniflora TaxID=39325 RepID=A0A7J7M5F8_9MAGN|nr:hypothetical protein GIB67_035717 [Kingdonia uniflora]
MSKVGDLAFKTFTAGLGVATIYLTGTFSVNVYRGLAWHKAQQVLIHLSLSMLFISETLVYHCRLHGYWNALCLLRDM